MTSRTKTLAGMAIFIALVVVLQLFASFVKLGPFSITLALAPIVVGSAVYGRLSGAVLGGAFGVVVLIMCINGIDPGGYMLWSANPALTAAIVLSKGIFAGLASGFIYSLLSKKNIYSGVVCAAIICPIVNTGILIAALVLFYYEILSEWAGGTDIVYFLFISMTGLNFLLEASVNIALCPAILRIIKASKSVMN